MKIAKTVADSLAPVIDLVYPPRCPLCGDALGQQGGLCLDCWAELEVPTAVSNAEEPNRRTIAAATYYNDASRKLILMFKHGGKIALAPMLARLMAAQLEQDGDSDEQPLIIPVPLHRFRMWRRGYNQSALLAQELAKLGKGEAALGALVRVKSTPSLAGLGKVERRKVLENAIAIQGSQSSRIAGRDIILVDDVFTSGATSAACVRALKAAGAASVTISCFAQATGGNFGA